MTNESYASLPFGDCLTQAGGSDCNYGMGGTPAHFTDQDRDTETRLNHFLFRQYSSTQGRWMTPDPAGMAAVDPMNPQSLNRYAYVLNNPLNAIDPLGLDCVYLNDAGDGVESVDHESDAGGCWGSGGYWADGWVGGGSWVTTDPNSNNIWITSSINGFLGNTYAGSNVNGGDAFSQGPFGLNDPTSVFTTYQPIQINPQGPGGDIPISDEAHAVLASAYLQSVHSLGCVGMSWAAGAGGSTLFQLGQPVAGSKSFITPGSSVGTSPLSQGLRDAFPQQLPFRVPTPVGGPGTGTSFRIAKTTSLGAAAGRYAPFAGAALMGYSVYKVNQCLSQTPGNP